MIVDSQVEGVASFTHVIGITVLAGKKVDDIRGCAAALGVQSDFAVGCGNRKGVGGHKDGAGFAAGSVARGSGVGGSGGRRWVRTRMLRRLGGCWY